VFADPESPLVAALPAPDPTDPESLFRASQTMASILQFIWPLPDKGLSKRLYRLAAPTLIVWGAQDGLVHPAYGEDFRAAIAGSRLEVVEGAGHIPQLEQAERTIGLITDFVG
jgi:pimeloyl-ACP methyl ester carboxylesterase